MKQNYLCSQCLTICNSTNSIPLCEVCIFNPGNPNDMAIDYINRNNGGPPKFSIDDLQSVFKD